MAKITGSLKSSLKARMFLNMFRFGLLFFSTHLALAARADVIPLHPQNPTLYYEIYLDPAFSAAPELRGAYLHMISNDLVPALQWLGAANEVDIRPIEEAHSLANATPFYIQIGDSRQYDTLLDMNPYLTDHLPSNVKSYTTLIEHDDMDTIVVKLYWDRIGLQASPQNPFKTRKNAGARLLSTLAYEIFGNVLHSEALYQRMNYNSQYPNSKNWKALVLQEIKAARASENGLRRLVDLLGEGADSLFLKQLQNEIAEQEDKKNEWISVIRHQFGSGEILDINMAKRKGSKCHAALL